MQIIAIDKNLIPYQVVIRLNGVSFGFEFNYNLHSDLFTVNLSRGTEILALGEPLIYKMPLFNSFYDERFPGVALIPLDPSNKSQRVGWSELGETVFLYLVELKDAESEGII